MANRHRKRVIANCCWCSVAKSSLTLQPHDLQHTRLPCPLLSQFAQTLGHSRWYYLTISSSGTSFSVCLQSFPVSRYFSNKPTQHQMAKVLRVSASVLPMNIKSWFPLGLTGLISLQSKGLSRVLSKTTIQRHQFFSAQPSLWSNSHIRTWLLKKLTALTIWTFISKVSSLLFNKLSRFVIAFLSRSKHLLILWL